MLPMCSKNTITTFNKRGQLIIHISCIQDYRLWIALIPNT